jgi:hypothetical protein
VRARSGHSFLIRLPPDAHEWQTSEVLPSSISAITAILLAIAPGFVAISVWARARTWKGLAGVSDLRIILQSLALSLVVQVIVSPLTIAWIWPVRTRLGDHPVRIAVWLSVSVLVVPFAMGLTGAKFTDALIERLGYSPGKWTKALSWFWPYPVPPSIWDWLFTTSPPNASYVILEFRDGRRVAGTFERGSMAMTSPEPHGIFLSEEWALDNDGNLLGPIPGSAGIMIRTTDDVQSVRLLEGTEDGGN